MIANDRANYRTFLAQFAISICAATSVCHASYACADEPIFPIHDAKIRAALDTRALERAELARRVVEEMTAEIDNSKEPDAEPFERRAKAYVDLRKFDKAFEDCTKGLAVMNRGSKSELFKTRARAAMEIGNHRQAQLDIKVALREQELEARKVVEETTTLIDKLTAPDPSLLRERGTAFMVLGDFDRAFDDFTLGISAKNRRGNGLFELRVMAAVGKGDYRQALKDSQDLANLPSARAESFAVLSLILSRSPDGQVRNAEEALDFAIRATITKPGSWDESLIEGALAAAYSVNGDFKLAVLHQERAIASEGGFIPAEMNAQLEAYKAGKEYPYQKMNQKK